MEIGKKVNQQQETWFFESTNKCRILFIPTISIRLPEIISLVSTLGKNNKLSPCLSFPLE